MAWPIARAAVQSAADVGVGSSFCSIDFVQKSTEEAPMALFIAAAVLNF